MYYNRKKIKIEELKRTGSKSELSERIAVFLEAEKERVPSTKPKKLNLPVK